MEKKKFSVKKIIFVLATVLLTVAITITVGALLSYAKNDSTMQNEYLTLMVGQNNDNQNRFVLFTNQGDLKNAEDNEKNIQYDNFYSSYSTININGKAYRFGEGENIKLPCYDSEKDAIISVQSFGGVEVTQTLTFADGMESGHNDMLLVTYSVKNTTENDITSGVRIMLDTQLENDDKCVVTADGELVSFEKTFAEELPKLCKCVSDDGKITTYTKYLSKPDSVVVANWSTLSDSKWDARTSNYSITDSVVAYVWNNKELKSNSEITYSVYYGVKNQSVETPTTVAPTEQKTEVSTTVAPTEQKTEVSTTVAPTEQKTEVSTTVAPTEQKTEVSTTVVPTEQKTEVSTKGESTTNTKPTGTSTDKANSTGANNSTNPSSVTVDTTKNNNNDGSTILTGDGSIICLVIISAIAVFVCFVFYRRKRGGEIND